MKKSFLLGNGMSFSAAQLFPIVPVRKTAVAIFTFLLTVLSASSLFSCDIELTVRKGKMLFSIKNPSGNAGDVYTWTMTGGIDAGGSGGTGAAPVAAEVALANNTYSTFTWKVNGSNCYSKKVRVKFVCETPGFTTLLDAENCIVKFNPYSNPPVIKDHCWDFGDGTPEAYTPNTSHTYPEPGGIYNVSHTTVEWTGQEFTVDQCAEALVVDCSGLNPPPVTPTDEAIASGNSVVKIYPNPASDWMQVETTGFSSSPTLARWYSITGALMMEQSWPENQTANRFDISNLPDGHYVMEVVCADGSKKNKQLVKAGN